MSIGAVSYNHAFGLKSSSHDSLFYIDESSILYPVGGNIIVSNIDQKSQKFVPVLDSGESISTLALSPDRHIIAVTESSNVPVITIYDLPHFRKRRVLHANVSESSTVQEFISVVFSSDSKYIAAQLGSPEWLLHYYSWEKGKLVACEKTLSRGDNANSFLRKPSQIVQIGLNPDDGTLISVLSDIGLCLYRYCEGSFNCEEFNYLPDEIYKAHCWLDSEVIALGTSQSGKIIIVNQATRTILSEIKIDSEFTPNRISIAQSSQQSQLSNISINWILKTNYGFICSGRNSHVVFNFQKKTLASNSSNETNPTDSQAGSDATLVAFRQIKSLMIPDENLEITAVAVSAAETSLLCQVSTNQLFRIALPSVNQSGKKDSQECQKLDPISQPFHHGTITGLDLCIRKPLLITCSPTDKSVRIYNYLTNTCELLKYFPEEAYSVAFHPSGLYALVGFSDKLRFMNVMIDELRVFREFGIRGCRECKFSNGGNVFAAISGSIIQLYSTWSFDNIANLKGHNGKVKSLFWTPDDSILVSCGSDGAVYSWNIRDLKRENEHILKSCSYTCAVCTPSGRSLYAVGSDKTLKEITDSTVSFEINCANVTPTQVVISHSGRMMFVGTSSGHVRAIRYPFSATLNNNASNANGENEYQQHVAHSSPVTKMRISYDDLYLFTVSEDGSLISFKISDREDRGIKRDRTLIFSDEILITKTDLEEKKSVLNELERNLEELTLEHEYQLRLCDMNFSEKVKEITEKFTQEIESLKISTSVLRSEKEKLDIKHDQEIMVLKNKHTQNFHDVEAKYNLELMKEYEKYQALQKQETEMQVRWQKQIDVSNVEKANALKDSQTQWESLLHQKGIEIEKLRTDIQRQQKECEEIIKQAEQDIDTEVQLHELRYEKKLQAEKDEGARLKGENGIMRKKFNTLKKDIDDNTQELQRMTDNEKKLQAVVNVLEKDVAKYRKEMGERDEIIQEKERRVYELKKKNQELEKFKFVLDFRIKELKEQVEPRETRIIEMTKQIHDIDEELEALSKQKQQFETSIQTFNSKLEKTKKDYAKEHRKYQDTQHYMKGFFTDLKDAIDYIQEPALLKKSVENLYKKYCSKESPANLINTGVDQDVKQEYLRQQEVLKTKISELRSQVEKRNQMYRKDDVHTVVSNQQLLNEVNRLRKATKKKAAFKVIPLNKTYISESIGRADTITSDSVLEDNDEREDGLGNLPVTRSQITPLPLMPAMRSILTAPKRNY